MQARWVAAFALASGCVGGAVPEVGSGTIVGGTSTEGDPAVGVVRIGSGICSGTLVEAGLVLTAKHCFAAGTQPSAVTFSTGPRGETLAGTATAFTHVGRLDGRVTDRDVLVLTLDTPVESEAVTLRREAMGRAEVGTTVRLVGYGVAAANISVVDPEKREGTTTILEMGPNHFNVRGGQQSCWGDSGGAAFQGGVLVGVISSTLTRSCTRASIMRVDRNLDLIDQARGKATWSRDPPAGGGDAPDGQPLPGRGTSGGDDSCTWANDGACDEPTYCEPGTDATDCLAAAEEEAPDDAADLGEPEEAPAGDGADACAPEYCLAGDGWCDEDLACCAYDEDCWVAPDAGDEEGCRCGAACVDDDDCCADCSF